MKFTVNLISPEGYVYKQRDGSYSQQRILGKDTEMLIEKVYDQFTKNEKYFSIKINSLGSMVPCRDYATFLRNIHKERERKNLITIEPQDVQLPFSKAFSF